MRHLPTLILLVIMVISGCDCDENIKCYEGTVVNYNCCSGITAISLTSHIKGAKKMTFNENEYSNVILVPNAIEDEHVFITLRKYMPESDADLLHPICLCVIGTDEVPTHVVTLSSTLECP
ncbi:MAG TPA: hypothetical protein VGK59_20590 [Ohtaekwangia sp.]